MNEQNRIENELINKAVKGDGRAFEKLIRKYDRQIMNLLLNILKNEDDASDAYQNTFIKVYNSLGRFKQTASFYTWIYRIAVNTAYSFFNKRPDHSEFDEAIHSSKEVADNFITEELELSDEEKKELIKKEIEKLSPQQKSVVYLKSYEGKKFREIAEVLSLNEGTVKKYFFRAVENIRNNIDL
ncbi:MAG: sigma-70 family RNA polymerase sigma factor [Candidatus Delongbacteria bacterium]|nr:sigma-70 family RNA polymerase sigma factor [Candidatus Delongbacteria bacterium]MCG2761365.1 sigma-70 family RNA polymerase sigma factor [Candidatus Delongbacteria bacterium]